MCLGRARFQVAGLKHEAVSVMQIPDSHLMFNLIHLLFSAINV